MCGVIGYLDIGSSDQPPGFSEALNSLSHRGPDCSGVWHYDVDQCSVRLGHTRLAIIDLDEKANQPMTLSGGQLTISFNGEIYNYLEIRKELELNGYVFRTNSDTEVLLAGWQHWGPSILCRVEGMFAFAIADTVERKIYLSRDAFGIKPLYYHAGVALFCFASEVKALKNLLSTQPIPDLDAAFSFLFFGDSDYDQKTFFDGVRAVPPGHFLAVDMVSAAAEIRRWYFPPEPESFRGRWSDAVDAVRYELREAIRLNCRSDVPVCVAYSAGLDSSVIAELARYLDTSKTITTLSFVDDVFNSREAALIVETARALSPNPLFAAIGTSINRELQTFIENSDQPTGTIETLAQRCMYGFARENGYKVVLDGQGADELFLGYDGEVGSRLKTLIENGRTTSAIAYAFSYSKNSGFSLAHAVQAYARERLPIDVRMIAEGLLAEYRTGGYVDRSVARGLGVDVRRWAAPSSNAFVGKRALENQRKYLFKSGLPRLLRYADVTSMSASVEARVPFLNLRLVNLVLSMPESYLVSADGRTKGLLRAAASPLFLERNRISRGKAGFLNGQSLYCSIDSKTRQDFLSQISCPFVDAKKLVELDRKSDLNGADQRFLWRALSYSIWQHQQSSQ